MGLSIITVNYNNKDGLNKTINNVKEFVVRYGKSIDIEYIIIDALSSDGSLNVINDNKDIISKFICESDNGIYDGMNKGIELATKQWLLFLNSGDIIEIDNFQPASLGDLSRNLILYDVELHSGKIKKQRLTNFYIFFRSICHQSMVIKKELFNNYRYDCEYRFIADNKFIVDNYSFIKHTKINKPLVKYDMFGVSSDSANKEAIWKEKEKMYDNEFLKKMLSLLFSKLKKINFELSKYK
ncbi:TPA: glycosyltransferase [Photobacterium damselae]